ncbi:SDR family oxidoreductase [Nocardia sp. CA2R105]|nr:SDR family oxidoreductase [Nocardia coffeae]
MLYKISNATCRVGRPAGESTLLDRRQSGRDHGLRQWDGLGRRRIVRRTRGEKGAAAAARLGGAARYVHTDVTSAEQMRALVGTAVTEFGKLDVMFSNAVAAVDFSRMTTTATAYV